MQSLPTPPPVNNSGKQDKPGIAPATTSGKDGKLGKSGPVLHIASLEPTSVSLTTSAEPVTVGQPVTFTAQVSSSFPGSETGNVLFYDGTTELGSVAVSADSGGAVATFTTSSLSAAMHGITADYQGDNTFAGSNSSTLTQVVRNTSSVSVSANVNPGTLDQSVTFTATVSSPMYVIRFLLPTLTAIQ